MPPANCCRIAMVIIPFSSPGPGSPSGQSWCCPLYRGAVSRCFATRWLGVADCCWRPASVSSPSPLHWRFGQCFRRLFHRANYQLYSGGHLLERSRDPPAQRPAFPRLHWNFAHCQTRLWLFHWTGLCPFCRVHLWSFSNPVASGRGPRGAQSAFVLTNAHCHHPLHAHGTDILAPAALRQPGHARHLWRRLYAWQYVFDLRLWACTGNPHGTLRLLSTCGRIAIGMGCLWHTTRYLGACRFGLADDLRLWFRPLAPLTPSPAVANSRGTCRALGHIHKTPGRRRAMAQKP